MAEGTDPKGLDRAGDARLRKAFRRAHAATMRSAGTKVDQWRAEMLDEFDRALTAQGQETARAGFTHGDCTNSFSKCQDDRPGLFCGCRLRRIRRTRKASKNYSHG
jgi:hypothetical protein